MFVQNEPLAFDGVVVLCAKLKAGAIKFIASATPKIADANLLEFRFIVRLAEIANRLAVREQK